MNTQVWLVLIDREMRKRVVALTALLFQLLSFAAFASAQAESAQTNAASAPASIQLLQRVPPTYPPLARSTRIQGSVVLDVVIGTDGSVNSATVVSGHPLLVQSAVDAVKQWKYKPYVLDGRAVEVESRITVQFALHADGEPNTPERAAQSQPNYYVDRSSELTQPKTGCPISHNPAMQGNAICTSKQESIAYCAQQMNKPDFLDRLPHSYFVRWTNNPHDHNDAWCDDLLSKDADVPPDIRAKMNEILKPVIERANERAAQMAQERREAERQAAIEAPRVRLATAITQMYRQRLLDNGADSRTIFNVHLKTSDSGAALVIETDAIGLPANAEEFLKNSSWVAQAYSVGFKSVMLTNGRGVFCDFELVSATTIRPSICSREGWSGSNRTLDYVRVWPKGYVFTVQ